MYYALCYRSRISIWLHCGQAASLGGRPVTHEADLWSPKWSRYDRDSESCSDVPSQQSASHVEMLVRAESTSSALPLPAPHVRNVKRSSTSAACSWSLWGVPSLKMKQFFPIPATSQSHPSLPFLCPIGKSVVAPLAEWGGAVATHVELFQISIIGDCHYMKPKLY